MTVATGLRAAAFVLALCGPVLAQTQKPPDSREFHLPKEPDRPEKPEPGQPQNGTGLRLNNPGTEQRNCFCCSQDYTSACCSGCQRAYQKLLQPINFQGSRADDERRWSPRRTEASDLIVCAVIRQESPWPGAERAATTDGNPLRSCFLKGTLPKNPEGATGKAFFQLPVITQCDATITSLKDRYDEFSAVVAFKTISDDQRQIAKAYLDQCLSGSASSYAPKLSDADRAEILGRLVFFLNDSDRIYCHGFRLGNLIISSEHCTKQNKPNETLQFRTARQADVRTAKVVMRGGFWPNKVADKDYMLLAIDGQTAADDGADAKWLSQPLAGERLFLLHVDLMQQALWGGGPMPGDLTATVSVQDNPSCRLSSAFRRGMLLNNCLADHGTSGAPYLQKDATGQLRLVGVHGGQTSTLPWEDIAHCGWAMGNFGVALPAAQIETLLNRP